MDITTLGGSPTDAVSGHETPDGALTGADRREHVRVTPDEHNRLAAKLSSGLQIRLLDLSRGGAQFECDRRFLPNASVSLRLQTRDGELQVTGRVVRSRIVRLATGGLGYLVAVAFADLLDTDLGAEAVQGSGSQGEAPPATRANAPAPTHDHAERAAETQPAVQAGPAFATELDLPDLVDREATEHGADISAEEALAFESTVPAASAMLTLTAQVDRTSDELHDMFSGNDW